LELSYYFFMQKKSLLSSQREVIRHDFQSHLSHIFFQLIKRTGFFYFCSVLTV
jgi:hypothetical protein